MVKDIIFMPMLYGVSEYIVMPPSTDNKNVTVFEDSFLYHNNAMERSGIMLSLSTDTNLKILDEAVPLCHLHSDNFWHWTLECLPRLLAL